MDVPDVMPPAAGWAKVRATDAGESLVCHRCPERAVLVFRAEYSVTGIVLEPGQAVPDIEHGEVRTSPVVTDMPVCMGHAGEGAVAAVYTMLRGPAGGV
jgi:hypothetical protein